MDKPNSKNSYQTIENDMTLDHTVGLPDIYKNKQYL